MNNRITKIFVAILDNRVIAISSNLSSFILEMRSIEAGINSLSYYDKRFKAEEVIYFTSRIGKTYTFQKIINPKYY